MRQYAVKLLEQEQRTEWRRLIGFKFTHHKEVNKSTQAAKDEINKFRLKNSANIIDIAFEIF